MVGEIVYIVEQHLIREHDRSIMGLYASWEGAKKALKRVRESEESFGYQVRESGYLTNYLMEIFRGDKVAYEFSVYRQEIRE